MKMETAPIGFVVVIKRNGTDGPKFPIKSSTNKLTFGRDETTDIRVQLPGVGLKHCQLNINDGKIVLENLSDNLPTTCNKIRVEKTKLLSHKDVFSIADRSFRVEYSVNPDSTSPKTELHDEIPFCDKTFDTFTPMKKKAKEQYTSDHFNNSEVVDKVVRRSPRILDKENKIPDKIINTPKSLLKRTSLSTKKRVSFGVLLSPEYFDKRLPPSTPIRRGASPGHRLLRSEPFIQRPLLLPEQNGSTNENDISCNTDAGQGDLDNLLMSSILSFDSDSNIDIFDDSPATKSKLPAPIQAEVVKTWKTNLLPPVTEEQEPTPQRSKKRALKTPLRKAIESKPTLRKTLRRGLTTPTRKQIMQGFNLKKTLKKRIDLSIIDVPNNEQHPNSNLPESKKLDTPLENQIACNLTQFSFTKSSSLQQQNINDVFQHETNMKLLTPLRQQLSQDAIFQETKRKLKTPLKNQINQGVSLHKAKKEQTPPIAEVGDDVLVCEMKTKIQTPLKKQIAEGLLLHPIKKKLQTPLRKQIMLGKSLRLTKMKLQTPLKKQISEGLLLRQTKRKLRAELRKQIKKGIALRETKKKLQTPLKKQISEGLLLRQTKRKLQTPLRNQIKGGVSLRQTMKKLQTPLKKQINEGLLLRQTKRKLQTPLRNQIKGGMSLRQTMKKMQTPLKKQINEGLLLRQTKRKLQTPLRNQIKGGVSLRQTMKKLQTPLKKQINEGLLLRQTKRKLQTPLRNQIKGGVSLRQTMKKMQTPLKKQISDGLLLRQTKRKLQTPLRNQIKGGMSLRQNVKKLQASLKKKTQKGTRLQNSNHLQANSYKKLKAQQTFPHVTNPILDADLVSLAENSQKNINMSPTQKYTKKRSTLYNKCKTDKEIKFDTNNDVDFHLSSSIKSDTTIRVISDGHFHLFSKYDEPGEEKLALEVNEKFVADNLKFSLNPDFTQTNGEAIIIPQHSNISHDSKFEISLHLENQNPIKFTNKEVSPLSEDSSLNDLDEQSSCTNNLPTQTVLNTKEHNVKANMQFHNSLNFPNEISSCSYRLPNVSYGQCEELKADLVEDLNVKKTSSEIFSKHDEQITSKSYQVGFDPMNEVVLTENSELLLKNSTQNTEISGQYSELSAATNLLQKPEVKNVHKKSDFTKVRTSTNNSGLVKCPVTRSNVREGKDCSNFSLVASNFSLVASNFSLVASKENEFVEDLEVNSVFKNSSACDVKFGESVSCTSTLHEILDLPTKSLNFENSGSDIFLDIDNSIYIEQSTFIQDLSESKISLTKDSLEEFVNTSVSESPLQEISASQVLPSVLNSNAMLTVNFPRSGTLPGGLISGTQLENKFEQVKSVLFEEKIKHRVNINQNVQELNTKNNEEQSSQLFEQLNQNLNDPLKSSPKPYTLSAQTKRKSKHKTCKFQLESSNFQLETNNLQNSINEEFVLSSLKDINTESDTRIEIGASNKVLPTKRSTRAKNIHNEIISDIAKSVTVNQTKRDQLEEKNEVVKMSLSDSTDMASKKALKERSFNSSETLTKKLDLPAKRVAKQVAERKIVDLKKSKKLKNEKDNVDKSETTKCTNDIHDNNITSKNSEHGGKLESVESCSKIYSTRARNALNNKTASDVININSQSVIDQNNKQVVELKDEIFKSPLTHITHSAKSTSVIHPISDDQLTIPQFSDELMNETNFGSELNFLSSGAKIIKDKKMENQVINFANQPEQPQALSTNTHNIIKRSTRSKQLNDCNSDRVTEKEISSSKENVQNVGLAVINQAKCSHLKKDTKNAHSKSTTVSNDEKSAFVRSTRSSKLKERETMSQIEVLEKAENNESNSNHVKHLVNLEKAQTNINNDVITCLTSVRRSNRSRKAEPAIEGNLNPGNEEYFSETGSRHNKEVIFDKNVLFAPSPTKKTKKSEEKMNECSRSPKSYDVSGVKFLLGNVALPTRRSTRRKRVCDVNANKKSLNQNQSVQSGFLINNDLDGNNKSLKSNSSQPNNTEIVIRTTSSPNKMEKTCLDRSTRTRKAKSSNPTTIHETVCESNHNNNTNADEVVTCSPRNLRRRKKNKDSDMPLIEKKHRRTTKDNPECLDSEETKVPLISQNLSYELQLTDQSGLVLKNDLFNVNEDVSKTRRKKSKVVPENSVDRSNRKKR